MNILVLIEQLELATILKKRSIRFVVLMVLLYFLPVVNTFALYVVSFCVTSFALFARPLFLSTGFLFNQLSYSVALILKQVN